MRVLIIGSTGFVGSYLYSYFLKKKIEVFSCSRKNADFIADFTTPVIFEDVFGCRHFDLVVFCINSYSTDVLDSIMGNVITVQNALECFAKEHSHMVMMSSISALPENNNNTAYNTSKRMAECLIEYHQKRDKHPITTIRFSQLFDENGLARRSQAGLFYYVDMIKAHKPINYYAKNDAKRTYFPAHRIGDVVMYLYEHHICGFHNIISKEQFTNRELLDLLTAESGYEKSLIYRDDEKEAYHYFIPDPSTLFENLISSISVRNELKKLVK